jgi:PAS domain S-box-containing protein
MARAWYGVDLLNLTHDTIFVRDMHDVITFWNRGAEERYGWTFAEVSGRTSHELLQTAFPRPLPEIMAALTRDGRWEGELVHTRRDGSKLVVASRWALQRDDAGDPVAILETNNDITERKRTEEALDDLAGRLIHAQEVERSRIGRELHDHIGQLLGVLAIQIDQLQTSSEITPATVSALAELRRGVSEVTEDVHRLSHRLHSSTLDYLGLVPALQKLVEDFATRLGIAVEFTPVSLPSPPPSDVALCLFRVTEESLTNIAKHSQARSVRVQVTAAVDGLSLTIDDDGVGFDVKRLTARTGLGFVSMQERLRLLRGTIRVESAPSRGTSIKAWVPAASLVEGVTTAAEQC